jgi:hypothetical protein
VTVTSTQSKTIVLGNGVTTVFNFAFDIPESGDEQITYTDAAGVSTVLASNLYTITGLGSPTGGTLTYPLIGSPIAAGTQLTIARILPLTQQESFSNQGAIFLNQIEAEFDRVVMQVQQIDEAQNRNLVVPITDAAPALPLPGAAQRANKALGFDGSGNPIALTTLPAGTVSSAMQPVVNAATLALGRTALGLGTMSAEGIGRGLQDDGAGNARVTFPTVGVGTDQTLTAANHDTQYIIGANLLFNLPKATTLFPGFSFLVFASAGNCTLVPNAADSIQGGSSGASFPILNGGQAWVVTDGISVWKLLYVRPSTINPTTQLFLAGSGTYLPTFGLRFAEFEMIAGGAGGAAAATNSGTNGGNTIMGAWTAAGGIGGAPGVAAPAGTGGTGGVDGVGTRIDRIAGSDGNVAANFNPTFGGMGGSSFFSGAGRTNDRAAGGAAKANTGSGGAGGGFCTSPMGGGGGAGEYVRFSMTAAEIGAGLSYSVGAAGVGGAAGTLAGGNGAAGKIIVREF